MVLQWVYKIPNEGLGTEGRTLDLCSSRAKLSSKNKQEIALALLKLQRRIRVLHNFL